MRKEAPPAEAALALARCFPASHLQLAQRLIREQTSPAAALHLQSMAMLSAGESSSDRHALQWPCTVLCLLPPFFCRWQT